MDEAAYAYLGHFAAKPADIALVAAESYQDALDWCDAVGQPDEGSFQALKEPLVLRLRAQLEMVDDGIDEEPFVAFEPHPLGALAWIGKDLERLLGRMENRKSTITGDVLRSYGDVCPECESRHFGDEECRAFLESANRLALHLGIVDKDLGNAIIVACPDEDSFPRLAAAAGKKPAWLGEVDPSVLFNFQLKKNGHARSVAEYACFSEGEEWLAPLRELLLEASQPAA